MGWLVDHYSAESYLCLYDLSEFLRAICAEVLASTYPSHASQLLLLLFIDRISNTVKLEPNGLGLHYFFHHTTRITPTGIVAIAYHDNYAYSAICLQNSPHLHNCGCKGGLCIDTGYDRFQASEKQIATFCTGGDHYLDI